MLKKKFIHGVYISKIYLLKVYPIYNLDVILSPDVQRNLQSAAIQKRVS